MYKNIAELIELEKSLDERKTAICADICTKIEEKILSGVKQLDWPVHACLVSSSAITNSGSYILSPSYYDSRIQARVVYGALLSTAKRNGVIGLRDQLDKIIKQKRVISGGETYSLNPNTISILENVQKEIA